MDWAKDLPFEVKVVGEDVESPRRGRLAVLGRLRRRLRGPREEDHPRGRRAARHRRASPSRVLGDGETCTGDPARRAGNEFVFQGLAQQNVETFKEYKVKKVVSTCAHCFNTLKNEYTEFGVELEVVHHTQLLNRLVREGKLTPVAATAHGCLAERARSPTTTPATSVGTTRSTRRRASCSRCCPAPSSSRWSATRETLLLLRRRRRADVDGGEASASGSTSTAPTEAVGDRRRPDRRRLPVLPGDALRRAHRQAGRGRRPRGGRGPRRRADAARLGAPRAGRGRRARPRRGGSAGCRLRAVRRGRRHSRAGRA